MVPISPASHISFLTIHYLGGYGAQSFYSNPIQSDLPRVQKEDGSNLFGSAKHTKNGVYLVRQMGLQLA